MARVQFKGIADQQEPESLPDDTYELRIIKANHGPGKTDPTKLRTEVILDCPAQPDSQGIFFYIGDENPDGDPKSESFKRLNAARFMTLFGIPFDNDGFDLEDFLGKTASVRTKSVKDEETGREGVNLILPPLLSE